MYRRFMLLYGLHHNTYSYIMYRFINVRNCVSYTAALQRNVLKRPYYNRGCANKLHSIIYKYLLQYIQGSKCLHFHLVRTRDLRLK